MKECESRKQRYDHTCFRCGVVIEAGEKEELQGIIGTTTDSHPYLR